jgi:hypothetical protein
MRIRGRFLNRNTARCQVSAQFASRKLKSTIDSNTFDTAVSHAFDKSLRCQVMPASIAFIPQAEQKTEI